jgi:hypothetical protein
MMDLRGYTKTLNQSMVSLLGYTATNLGLGLYLGQHLILLKNFALDC